MDTRRQHEFARCLRRRALTPFMKIVGSVCRHDAPQDRTGAALTRLDRPIESAPRPHTRRGSAIRRCRSRRPSATTRVALLASSDTSGGLVGSGQTLSVPLIATLPPTRRRRLRHPLQHLRLRRPHRLRPRRQTRRNRCHHRRARARGTRVESQSDDSSCIRPRAGEAERDCEWQQPGRRV